MKPKSGSYYKHFKGGIYCVLGIGKHSETGDEMVVYRAMIPGPTDGHEEALTFDPNHTQIWIRPLSMWFDLIDRDHYQGTRFTLYEGGDNEEGKQLWGKIKTAIESEKA